MYESFHFFDKFGTNIIVIAVLNFEWDNILNNARLLLDFLHDYGFDYNSVELIQSPIPIYASDNGNTHQYPVEHVDIGIESVL